MVLEDNSQRRQYYSVIRKNRALTTKKRILAVAEELFAANGYGGTSISAIADKAHVAAQTIYAIFKNKSALVVGIFEQITNNVDFKMRYLASRNSGNPYAILRELSRMACEVYTNKHLLFERLIEVLGTIEELKEMVLKQRLRERELLRTPINDLKKLGVLRPELQFEDAVDLLWTLTSSALYVHLVKWLGWSEEKYAAWLEDILRTGLTTLASPSGNC